MRILVGEVSDPELVCRRCSKSTVNCTKAVTALAHHLDGRATRDAIERTTCAVIDLPQGAIRRHLVQGVPVPRSVRSQVAAAMRAALLDPTGRILDVTDDVDGGQKR